MLKEVSCGFRSACTHGAIAILRRPIVTDPHEATAELERPAERERDQSASSGTGAERGAGIGEARQMGAQQSRCANQLRAKIERRAVRAPQPTAWYTMTRSASLRATLAKGAGSLTALRQIGRAAKSGAHKFAAASPPFGTLYKAAVMRQ